MKRDIVWLASYPKSGNTWVRAFLTGLLQGELKDLNKLLGFAIARRDIFDDLLGVKSSELNDKEITQLRPYLYAQLAEEEKTEYPVFFKIHTALTNDEKHALVPLDNKQTAVYIIRNPLDVVLSFVNHFNMPIDSAIQQMCNRRYTLGAHASGRFIMQFEQLLMSWSEHVKSWVDQTLIPVHVIRYEDMQHNPIVTFKKMVDFLKITSSSYSIKKAIDLSQFKRLQRLEQSLGFTEKPSHMKGFFRQGEIGQWQAILTKKQIEKIIEEHGEIMERFDYLPPFYKT